MEGETIEDITSKKDEGAVVEAETVETLKAKNQSLYERLKKAEGFERDEDGAWVKKAKEPEHKPEPKPKKSDEFDYGQKAFLVANGIKTAEEMKLAREMMNGTGKSLDEIMESKYFKAELESLRELKKTDDAIPSSRRSAGTSTDSVDYWMTKPFSEVPKDMRAKVIAAKEAKETGSTGFYNS